MTIENPERYLSSAPDWSMLDGCFGDTPIRPSDVDGMVERRGCMLWLEHKSGPGASIKQGQKIAYGTFVKRAGWMVIVFWSNGESSSSVRRLTIWTEGHIKEEWPADLTRLRELVTAWFAYANLPARERTHFGMPS
jgi:hypothetical protein